jgi:imidazoleglycerol phosphate synthase cyclase subunit
MLTRRLIPCLDVAGGQVVKGVRFQELMRSGDPLELARRYAADGADELVLLDISATVEERGHALATVRSLRGALDIPLCAGGGLRSLEDAAALLYAGADKVAVNSAAWKDPSLVTRLADRFGSQCVVVAIDARRCQSAKQETQTCTETTCPSGYELVIAAGRQGTGADVLAWAQQVEALGAGELLVTSIDRDGTQSGYELDLLRRLALAVQVPVIASGGARHAEHLAEALDAGASAVLVASILHNQSTTVLQLKQDLIARGYPLRPC